MASRSSAQSPGATRPQKPPGPPGRSAANLPGPALARKHLRAAPDPRQMQKSQRPTSTASIPLEGEARQPAARGAKAQVTAQTTPWRSGACSHADGRQLSPGEAESSIPRKAGLCWRRDRCSPPNESRARAVLLDPATKGDLLTIRGWFHRPGTGGRDRGGFPSLPGAAPDRMIRASVPPSSLRRNYAVNLPSTWAELTVPPAISSRLRLALRWQKQRCMLVRQDGVDGEIIQLDSRAVHVLGCYSLASAATVGRTFATDVRCSCRDPRPQSPLRPRAGGRRPPGQRDARARPPGRRGGS